MPVNFQDLEKFLEWVKIKARLKFNSQNRNFPLMYNCLYWAYLGDNIGSEEGKHRPVLITRTYKNSPIVVIIPLTTQRLGDNRPYHVDLQCESSTALVEQMRVIDVSRIDKPYRKKGAIVKLTTNDWQEIDAQIKKQYLLSPLSTK